MNVGNKIRELRLAKLMTQGELAGAHMTRNMLSLIENGKAAPSLPTVLYIAERLNVPAGFLLAEEGDETVFRKMQGFSNIRRAYVAGDLRGCKSLCLSACPEPDDEISLLLAECDMGIAEEEFWAGRLHSAGRYLDEALNYAEKTIYSTAHIEAKARVYFAYMTRLSPALYSDVPTEKGNSEILYQSPFASYVRALEKADAGEYVELDEEADAFFASHLKILKLQSEGRYAETVPILKEWLDQPEPLDLVRLYTVLCELETSCREMGDYKSAYTYSKDKMNLLERMLKEI